MKYEELNPKDWVLVRDSEDDKWCLAQFSHYDDEAGYYPYNMCGGAIYADCIPYKGNERLLGKKDEYVEPYSPKDGDFVYVKSKNGDHNNELVFIHHYTDKEGRVYSHAEWCLAGDCCGLLEVCPEDDGFLIWKDDILSYRLATEEEKQILLSKLEGVGKEWDAEEMKVLYKATEKEKWRPGARDKYWYVDSFVDADWELWADDDLDNVRVEAGNFFRTHEEAQAMADKFKKILKGE